MSFFIPLITTWLSFTNFADAAQIVKQLKTNGQACYGREYSDAEMSLNPGQKAKNIRIYLLTDKNSDSIYMYVYITLKKEIHDRKSKRVYSGLMDYQIDMDCHTIAEEEGKIFCRIFCNLGSVTLTWDPQVDKKNDNLTLVNENFAVNGSCLDLGANFAQHGPEIFANSAGNERFTLYPLPEEFCY